MNPLTTLQLQSYAEQLEVWPRSGRCILAQFDAESIVVYQAYNPRIGEYAAREGRFGGDFSFNRMSWIKPNFLWMMYRCGWGEKHDQTCVLAVRLRLSLWDEILSRAVPSTFAPELFSSEKEWKKAVADSKVRLQWDPDHTPRGGKVARRAIQLGLRGEILRRFATEALAIEDISAFVAEQKPHVQSGNWNALMTPRERPCPLESSAYPNLGVESKASHD